MKTKLVALIFSWAKEVYPEGVFMLNDHIPFLATDELRERYVELIKNLANAGAAIDVVGLEGHLGYRPLPFQLPPDELTHLTLDEIHDAAGCPLSITEFDLSYDNGPVKEYPGSRIDPTQPFVAQGIKYDSWFEYQAFAYKHFHDICLAKGYIDDLVFWGFRDDSNIAWERPGTGFFNEDFSPKPVYSAMADILK